MKIFSYSEGDPFHVDGVGNAFPPDGMLVTPEAAYYVLVHNDRGKWLTRSLERVDLASVHAGGERRWLVEPWQVEHRPRWQEVVAYFGLTEA